MPGTTDAIAITTEDMQFDTITPAQAFEMVQSAMKKGQEAMDALSPKIKNQLSSMQRKNYLMQIFLLTHKEIQWLTQISLQK